MVHSYVCMHSRTSVYRTIFACLYNLISFQSHEMLSRFRMIALWIMHIIIFPLRIWHVSDIYNSLSNILEKPLSSGSYVYGHTHFSLPCLDEDLRETKPTLESPELACWYRYTECHVSSGVSACNVLLTPFTADTMILSFPLSSQKSGHSEDAQPRLPISHG